jgi:hypothetical protein
MNGKLKQSRMIGLAAIDSLRLDWLAEREQASRSEVVRRLLATAAREMPKPEEKDNHV